jgi:transposase
MDKAIMIGIDTAKNVFEVHGRNAAGEVVLRRRLKRAQMEKFFSSHPKALIGMEACGSAHYWGRLLEGLGHEVRLMPPAYVKPYIKRNKNDGRDAEGCCEAVSRPGMRFVRIKTAEQQASLSLHRSRQLLVRQRTQLGNAFRSLLAEFGVVAAKGREGLAKLATDLRAGELDLPAAACSAALALADQRANLVPAIKELERQIAEQAKAEPRAKMLQTAPGVGPMTAHATLATVPDPAMFKSGRDFAAWVGLTPRESSSGGKQRLGSITKQGDQTLRRLLVLGATAWLRQVEKHPEKASPWLRGMMARRPKKVVAVAQAARTARILWAMLTHNQPYRAPVSA